MEAATNHIGAGSGITNTINSRRLRCPEDGRAGLDPHPRRKGRTAFGDGSLLSARIGGPLARLVDQAARRRLATAHTSPGAGLARRDGFSHPTGA